MRKEKDRHDGTCLKSKYLEIEAGDGKCETTLGYMTSS